MRKMSNKLITECIDTLHDYAGVILTEDQFNDLMKDNPSLVKQLIKYNSPRDTMDRECMMEVLAKRLTGRPWPCYGEGEKVFESFIQVFNENATKQGYKLVG